jgi:RNA polymerase sigma-70 factor (ECF subfamily)
MLKRDSSAYNINAIVDDHEKEIYWYLRKLLISHENTKDVLQETFLRAWKNLDTYRGDAKISTWLYRIAHNEALRFLEKEKKRLENNGSNLEEDLLNKLRSDEYISGDEIQMTLQEEIIKLPIRQREVFTMRYFDDLSYEEISEILGTSIDSLKVSYHHAKKKITEKIKKL